MGKGKGEKSSFEDINLYDNHLGQDIYRYFVKRAAQYGMKTNIWPGICQQEGCFPKAWQRAAMGFRLLKGGEENSRRELLAAGLAGAFVFHKFCMRKAILMGKSFRQQQFLHPRVFLAYGSFYCFLQNERERMSKIYIKIDAYNYYMNDVVDYWWAIRIGTGELGCFG